MSKFKITTPDGHTWEPEQTPWFDNNIRRVMVKIAKNIRVTQQDWDRMLKYAEYSPRVLVCHHRHGTDYYHVTPDTLEGVCAGLIEQYYKDSWFQGKTEVDALEAIKNNNCYRFWLENDHGPRVELESYSKASVKTLEGDRLDTQIFSARRSFEASETTRKAKERERLEANIAEAQAKLDAL